MSCTTQTTTPKEAPPQRGTPAPSREPQRDPPPSPFNPSPDPTPQRCPVEPNREYETCSLPAGFLPAAFRAGR